MNRDGSRASPPGRTLRREILGAFVGGRRVREKRLDVHGEPVAGCKASDARTGCPWWGSAGGWKSRRKEISVIV